jgi:hypothetical protein
MIDPGAASVGKGRRGSSDPAAAPTAQEDRTMSRILRAAPRLARARHLVASGLLAAALAAGLAGPAAAGGADWQIPYPNGTPTVHNVPWGQARCTGNVRAPVTDPSRQRIRFTGEELTGLKGTFFYLTAPNLKPTDDPKHHLAVEVTGSYEAVLTKPPVGQLFNLCFKHDQQKHVGCNAAETMCAVKAAQVRFNIEVIR